MSKKMKVFPMIILIAVICTAMAFVDAVISPEYFIKSAIKLVLFLGIPMLYLMLYKDVQAVKDVFRLNKRGLLIPVLLGIGVYVIILGAYAIIGPYFDFSNVTVALEDNYGVQKENFVPVALYISFINSLLEEFFFRGFAFLMLKRLTARRYAYIFSSAAFAVYHIAIITGWFHLPLFLLLIFSLFVAGLFFNWLNEKSNTIYTSWLVHMCANFATNTIGFILFGII